jgi:iron complex outermembrane receptor protein
MQARTTMQRRKKRLAVATGLTALLGVSALAQTPQYADPIVVTATRTPERAFELPVSIDSVNQTQIQQDQLQVNLSESLVRVPGISVGNRWNYAQDLQISVRGFGARANFGVRGVRLYQDGIPATMPDGQGQTGSFSLVSAERIEVLRGPFSTLYGNASGGVISIFTETGGEPGFAQGQAIGGSYGTWNGVLKLEGGTPAASYVVAGNLFDTQGYREHSEASRSLANAKLTLTPNADTTITLVGNYLGQPEAQDPLGLTRAEWEQNPRQADPVAVQFNTRKTVSQGQGGFSLEQRLNADNVARVVAYGGQRTVRQYLALPGTLPTSSGGVSDLDNDFGGVDARLSSQLRVGGGSLTLTVGGDYDRQHQRRKGYVNNNGALGDLRRDEDDYVSDTDAYLQAEWAPIAALSIIGGVRYSDVRFNSNDHYVTSVNPDDSGQVSYSHTSPVIGGVWHVNDKLNLYVNWGEGFETPTFIELAYKTVGSGLNFGLQPAVSRSGEVGLKTYLTPQQRVNIALFATDTSNEIIIDTATGGRTTYKNASKTQRRGVEASWDANLGNGFSAYASYTYLSAKFSSDATTGNPPLPIPSGARLPGVPQANAYAELVWSYPQWYGLVAAIEGVYAGKIYVNERNADYAPAYAIANIRAGIEQRAGAWSFREFVRVNNLFNKNYVATVIVGDTNGRYFEPSAVRNIIVGASANVAF